MTTGRKLLSDRHIPAYHGGGVLAKKGQRVKVINTQGQQVGDLFAFVLDDPGEYLSPDGSWSQLRRIYPVLGQPLYSNKLNPLLNLEEDTVGVHDFLLNA